MVQLAAFGDCSAARPISSTAISMRNFSAGARRFPGGGEASRARRLGAPVRTRAPLAQRLGAPKALVLDMLSAQFRKRAASAASLSIPAFAGAYDFSTGARFRRAVGGFLDGLPEGGLVMCHPGFVDETLVASIR